MVYPERRSERVMKSVPSKEMIGTMFPSDKSTVSKSVNPKHRIQFSHDSENFRHEEPQPSLVRYRPPPTVQCTSLPQYAIWIACGPRHSAFYHKPPREAYGARQSILLSTPHGWIPAQVTPAVYSKLPQKLPAQETGTSTVQRENFRGKTPSLRQ